LFLWKKSFQINMLIIFSPLETCSIQTAIQFYFPFFRRSRVPKILLTNFFLLSTFSIRLFYVQFLKHCNEFYKLLQIICIRELVNREIIYKVFPPVSIIRAISRAYLYRVIGIIKLNRGSTQSIVIKVLIFRAHE